MATHEPRSPGGHVLYDDSDGEGEGADPDETVWIAPRAQVRSFGRCYHTDPTCRHVDRERFRQMTRERAEQRYDVDECAHCSGTASTTGQGSGHYQALLAAARDDGEGED